MGQPEGPKLPFQVLPYEPMVIVVTDSDKKQYRVSVRVAILEVIETKDHVEKDGKRIPLFQFRAQMVAETNGVEAPDSAVK